MQTDTDNSNRGVMAPADGNTSPNAPGEFSREKNPSFPPQTHDDGEAGAITPESFGANFERLEDERPDLVNALRELVRQYRSEGVVARRHEIRRIRQARLFWQGMHYTWWNESDMNWHLPYEHRAGDDRSLEDMPRYQFVTNFYQGFGLSFVAVLSQDVPSVRFYPQSFQSLVDIAAARAASDVAELIERNNHVEHLLTSIGYFLWTDGKLGAYVRYVEDAQRFGSRDEEILEAVEIPLGPDKWLCPQCGKETNAEVASDERATASEGNENASGVSTNHESQVTNHESPVTDHESRITNHVPICPHCHAQLTENNLHKAERVTVPRVSSVRRVPNGQEIISIAGGLELNTPVWANEMHEFPYLQWQVEVHRAKLKAAYPWVADRIESAPAMGAEDVYALRLACQRRAGNAHDCSRRCADEPHHLRPHLATPMGFLFRRRRNRAQ